MNDALLNNLTQSLSGLSFANPSLFTGDPTAFLRGLTVGDFRTLITDTKSFLQSQDFSSLSTVLNNPQISGSLDGPTKTLIQNLIDGDFSFFLSAFDVALESVAGFAAGTALLTALDSNASGGGGDGGGLTAVQTEFLTEVADLFQGSSGRDKITAQAEIGRILAGGGDDTVKGSAGADNIKGAAGDDVLRGRGGDDKLNGGGGSDKIIGGGGDDNVRGGGGGDIARGGGGSDTLKGNGGKDNLNGGGASDMLEGGGGADKLKGGGGNDFFAFKTGAGSDVILDFHQGDTIMISRGANDFADLSISQQGGDVLIEFANVDILIRTDQADNFQADDFMFT